MIKLKLQKHKNYSKLLIISKIKKKSPIPIKLGNTYYNLLIIKYYLIIMLQKYGFTTARGLRKFLLINL